MADQKKERMLRGILIEDNSEDATLVREYINDNALPLITVDVVSTLAEGTRLLRTESFDFVLLDLDLPDSSGMQTFDEIQKAAPSIPMAIISGTVDPSIAERCIKSGAHGFLGKDSLGPFLGMRIWNIVLRAEIQAELTVTRNSLNRLVSESPDGVLVLSPEGIIRYANSKANALFEDLLIGDFFGFPISGAESTDLEVLQKDGGICWVEMRVGEIIWNGDMATMVTLRDVTQRRNTETMLLESEAKYTQLVNNVHDILYAGKVKKDSSAIEFSLVSPKCRSILGVSPKKILGNPGLWLKAVHPDDVDRVNRETLKALSSGQLCTRVYRIKNKKTGEYRWLEDNIQPELSETGRGIGFFGVARDITEKKKLEFQLRQAQKMEAIGTLAGGIAHDFNNLLTTILGYGELMLTQLSEDNSLRKDIEEILKAGTSAASLTRQLLAFSRKQVMKPEVININDLLTEKMEMLSRLIGESISLNMCLSKDLCQIKVDPAQMEQVMLNLIINAKDAMPVGGIIRIETHCVDLDEKYAKEHGVEIEPGPYVVISVSDTGIGMDQATCSRIFEPFFTTKEKYKGTGLGLSMVYGIIKQSGGYIWAYSEPGEGTSFKIYLPNQKKENKAMNSSNQTSFEHLVGTEIVLVVEDNQPLRKLAEKILRKYGYTVLVAKDPKEALSVSMKHTGHIHMLVTDVVMPWMSGFELAERLQKDRPGLKIIYMSGYSDEAVQRYGVSPGDFNFLEKPFSSKTIGEKIREVLDLEENQ